MLASILSSFSSKRIVVIGDVMLDEYHWCDVTRISPEAPVPVCRIRETTLIPGGAANVARNLHSLGADPILFGLIGDDGSGRRLCQVLSDEGVDSSCLVVDVSRPTILKSRIVAHQQHVVRVDREQSGVISPVHIALFLERLSAIVDDVDAIVFSDYLKGVLTPELIEGVLALFKSRDIPIVVDPKGDDYQKYKGVAILTPNFGEFQAVVKESPSSEVRVRQLARQLTHDLDLDALLITRSEKGMSLILNDEKIDIPTRAKDVYDITGAGDTVVSMLVFSLAHGVSFLDSAQLANYAAGLVVGKVGTSTVTLDEVRRLL